MNYICMVFNDPTELDRLSESEFGEVCRVCGDWVGELELRGKHVFSAGLQSPTTAKTFRRLGSGVKVTDGPYTETKELLGGFTIFDADSHEEAVAEASKLAAICKGTLELRPVMDPFAELSDPIDQKLARAIRSSMPQIMAECDPAAKS